MRRVQQKKVLEMLKTLDEATTEMRRLFSRKEISSVIQVLADCQEFAVRIGNYIEGIESEGMRTVALLEGYCEQLYNVCVEINDGTIAKNFTKRLGKTLLSIENSVRTDLKPNRIEVAFLPYKRAMSDSLESIWKAARQDPQCDAYIVPLPYYDRLPGGAFGQMHYEGSAYPSDVSITDWQAYNVETRHPDIIFIHYPYDGENFVTSLHPDFYSKRLKGCCDLLVYVPYFVCVDDVQEHFCVCAGTLHADKVIVQSEKVLKTYIRVFKEFEKKNNCKGVYGKAEEKFVVLGSPKFDAVMNAEQTGFILPDTWRKLLEKSDGTKKKAFFYNTTISALLHGDEQYLQKIRSVLKTFRAGEDAVLWWRPHPLNEATYRSMNPRLLGEYESLIADYKRGGWGIYDDSPDLHRAIAWSDAYYGDPSSVVALYKVTGKPIMIQNINTFNKGVDLNPLSFYADSHYIWYMPKRYNALFKMNREDWIPQYVCSLPGAPAYARNFDSFVFGIPAVIDGVMYFPPYQAKDIVAYSMRGNSFENYPYRKSGTEEIYHRDFFFAVAYLSFVFFIPYHYPGILRLNPQNGNIEYFVDWVKPIQDKSGDVTGAFFLCPIVIGHKMWLASCCANAVVEFNMETLASTVHEVGKQEYRYNGICFDGENFWLSPRLYTNTPVVKWNPEKGVINELNGLVTDKDKCSKYLLPLYSNGYVWLFPHLAQHVCKINVVSDEISIVAEFERDFEEENIRNQRYAGAYLLDESIFIHDEVSKTFIQFNTKTNSKREEALKFSAEILERIEFLLDEAQRDGGSLLQIHKNFSYYENSINRLSDFADLVVNEKESKEMANERRENLNSVNTDGTVGQAIYEYTKKFML